MPLEDDLIKQLFSMHMLEEEPNHIRGIAQLAADKGFANISAKQKAAIRHIFTRPCEGVTNPGGHHNNCGTVLKGDRYLDALNNVLLYEAILCESCRVEDDGYKAHWERIKDE